MTLTMKKWLVTAVCTVLLGTSGMLSGASTPESSIEAIRYSTAPDVRVSDLVGGGPKDEKIDIACVVWLVRGGGHTILFDSGYHRDPFLKWFPAKDYLRPDEAV